jgi:hypothetical protein
MDQSQLDPELIQAVLGMQGQDDPQAIALKRQQAQVNALRGQSLQPREGHMAGRVYVGPGIADALSQGFQGYAANQMQGGIDSGVQDLSHRNMAAKGKYVDALTRAMRRAPPNNMQTPAQDVPSGFSDDLGFGSTPQAGY